MTTGVNMEKKKLKICFDADCLVLAVDNVTLNSKELFRKNVCSSTVKKYLQTSNKKCDHVNPENGRSVFPVTEQRIPLLIIIGNNVGTLDFVKSCDFWTVLRVKMNMAR